MSSSPIPTAPFTPQEGRRFGLVVGGAFLALAALSFWRGRTIVAISVLGTLGFVLVVWGTFAPARLAVPYRLWMGLARVLAPIMTPVFMAVMYFVVLTPIAIIRRLLGGNPLVARGADGYWVERPRGHRSSMERQF
jgi:hypothetical protein